LRKRKTQPLDIEINAQRTTSTPAGVVLLSALYPAPLFAKGGNSKSGQLSHLLAKGGVLKGAGVFVGSAIKSKFSANSQGLFLTEHLNCLFFLPIV